MTPRYIVDVWGLSACKIHAYSRQIFGYVAIGELAGALAERKLAFVMHSAVVVGCGEWRIL